MSYMGKVSSPRRTEQRSQEDDDCEEEDEVTPTGRSGRPVLAATMEEADSDRSNSRNHTNTINSSTTSEQDQVSGGAEKGWDGWSSILDGGCSGEKQPSYFCTLVPVTRRQNCLELPVQPVEAGAQCQGEDSVAKAGQKQEKPRGGPIRPAGSRTAGSGTAEAAALFHRGNVFPHTPVWRFAFDAW